MKNTVAAVAGTLGIKAVDDWVECAGLVSCTAARGAWVAIETVAVPFAFSAEAPAFGRVPGTDGCRPAAIGVVTAVGAQLEVAIATESWLVRAVLRTPVRNLQVLAISNVAEVVSAGTVVNIAI